MDARTKRFIERMGLLSETDGLPRIAGRIFGLLLVTPGECSLDEMAEQLGVSKASVSNDTRRLADLGLLERTSRPGDRRDYYSIAPNVFERSLEARLARMERVHEAMREASELPSSKQPGVRERLEELDAAWEFAVQETRGVLDRWREHVAAARGRR